MVSKGTASDDETSLCSGCTSESSDSHSYLLWDIENPGNNISEEWDAIERTLYQENGKHVTDPALLKECKLWRETFLHLRARGTANNSTQNGALQEAGNVQDVDEKQFAMSKLKEKRENIRKAVVSQIVERLTSKLCLNKQNSSRCTEKWREIMDGKTVDRLPGANADSESYFERGKKSCNGKGTVERVNADASNGFGSDGKSAFSNASSDFGCRYAADMTKSETNSRVWSESSDEKRNQANGKRFASNMARNEEIMRSENLKFKISEKPLLKAETGMLESLSGIAKPLQVTKKISKKYEVMLERILDGRKVAISGADKRNSPKPIDFGEKLATAEQKHRKDHKQLPKINNFANNWMTRAEHNLSDPYWLQESIDRSLHTRPGHGKGRRIVDGPSRSASSTCHFDERFFEELKREMWIQKQSQAGNLEEKNSGLPRPGQRRDRRHVAETQKSSSCCDLQKKTPKAKGGTLKCSLEKGRSDVFAKGKKAKIRKNAGQQNLQLPPIEASIICTEIIGKPKVTTRTLPKKYM